MSKAFNERKKARLYAAVTYRNQNVLEDRHASDMPLDEGFYREMLCVMTESISQHKTPIEKAMGLMGMRREELVEFMDDPAVTKVILNDWMMSGWDNPSKVRDRFVEEAYARNIAKFVLQGRFLEFCKEGTALTDSVMCSLNHDIYNRFYTLVCRGIL